MNQNGKIITTAMMIMANGPKGIIPGPGIDSGMTFSPLYLQLIE
jgi:hypothetical protein